jgi:hypothetical protein
MTLMLHRVHHREQLLIWGSVTGFLGRELLRVVGDGMSPPVVIHLREYGPYCVNGGVRFNEDRLSVIELIEDGITAEGVLKVSE